MMNILEVPLQPHYLTEKVVSLAEQGFNSIEIAKKLECTDRNIRHILNQERSRRLGINQATIDPSVLPLSSQQKIEKCIQQAVRRLEEQKDEEIRRHVDEVVLPLYREKLEAEKQIIELARKMVQRNGGLMSQETYKLILSCLHPDRVQDKELKKKYSKAFHAWQVFHRLIAEDAPTFSSNFPRTLSELMAAKKAADERRKAARLNKRPGA